MWYSFNLGICKSTTFDHVKMKEGSYFFQTGKPCPLGVDSKTAKDCYNCAIFPYQR